jgi:predicted nucleic acid-binding protein
MKIVLDTNVLVSGLLQPLGNPAQVLTLALAGAVQICHEGASLLNSPKSSPAPASSLTRNRSA